MSDELPIVTRHDEDAVRDAVLIASVAFAIRIAFCFLVYPSIASRFGPQDGYDVIAANLAHGRGYTLDVGSAAERLPLYPALLTLGVLAFGTASWPWQVAQSLCSAVSCVLVFDLARRYASRAGALAAAAFCAVHPTLVLYAARPLTETLYVLLLLLFVRALAEPRTRATATAAGTLWGLQLLTKTTALLGAVALVPLLVRRQLAGVRRAVACATLVLAPWVTWSAVHSGQTGLVAATGGMTLYHGLYISQHVGWTTPADDLNLVAEWVLWYELSTRGVDPAVVMRDRDRFAGENARAWIAAHPFTWLQLTARNVLLTWYLTRDGRSMVVHFALHAVLLIAAAIGARRLWNGGDGARQLTETCAAMIGAYTLFYAAIQPAVRYILPVVPLAAVLAAAAVPARRSAAADGDRA